jgi:hypothetical protein
MCLEELRALGDDINRTKGTVLPIALWGNKLEGAVLLNGRNRLDAMEAVGVVVV